MRMLQVIIETKTWESQSNRLHSIAWQVYSFRTNEYFHRFIWFIASGTIIIAPGERRALRLQLKSFQSSPVRGAQKIRRLLSILLCCCKELPMCLIFIINSVINLNKFDLLVFWLYNECINCNRNLYKLLECSLFIKIQTQ